MTIRRRNPSARLIHHFQTLATNTPVRNLESCSKSKEIEGSMSRKGIYSNNAGVDNFLMTQTTVISVKLPHSLRDPTGNIAIYSHIL